MKIIISTYLGESANYKTPKQQVIKILMRLIKQSVIKKD